MSSPSHEPVVSIGMPVFNAERTVDRALASIRSQTVRRLEILVSDNASTDRTLDVCRSQAAGDARVRVIRQPANRGAVHNFSTVLDAARAPFFMWAAADDVWKPAFVERNLHALQDDGRLVASISQVQFMDASGTYDTIGTMPLTGEVSTNLATYLDRPGPNSRFYGVYRRDVLARSLVREAFLAWDWAVVARTLTYGQHGRIEECLLQRGASGESHDLLRVIRQFNKGLGRAIPLLPFTRCILRDARIPKNAGVLAALAKHNLAYVIAASRQRAGRRPRSGRDRADEPCAGS